MSRAVSVFGLGYVGCVSAACLAKEGHRVIGVDVAQAKVDMINRGQSTIVEQGIAELVAETHASGRLRATTDATEAVAESEISLVCVGTPSRPNGALDLSYVERVSEQIGAALAAKTATHTVVVRSTMLPGSTDEVVRPALAQCARGQAFRLAVNPEFLREGSSIRDFREPPFTLVGAGDDATAAVVAELYAGVAAPVHVVPIRVAEMVKYVSNCFHALKVGFANEVGNIAKALGVDSHEVMRIVCEDRKLNISPAYLRPGFAFGGSCLPKDLRAMTYRARQLDLRTPILEAITESNEKQIARAYDMILAAGHRRVGVVGLAFKSGTDDLRESPLVTLIERLIGRGLQVAIYDREVRQARLMGSNREYIEREIPHIWSLMRSSIDEVLATSETIVIGNASPELERAADRIGAGQVVIDLARAFGPRTSDGRTYEGICW